MSHLLEAFHVAATLESAHEVSLGHQALLVHILRQGIQRHLRFEATHPHTHWRSSLQVQFMRKVVHAALLPGVALPQSSRRSAPVRIQGASHEGMVSHLNINLHMFIY
jgi:hypothetical protein